MITQEQLKSILHYNKLTGEFTRLKTTSSSSVKGSIAGSKFTTSGKSYLRVRIFKKDYYLHRLAFLYVDGDMPSNSVDHVDGDGTNNSWLNLRRVSHLDNLKNQRLHSISSCGISGVGWSKSKGKWEARISDNGKRIALGCFDNIFDAACARKSAESKYNYHHNHGTDRPL